MLMLIYGIVEGIPYKMMHHFGLQINKDTYTSYVKDVGYLIAEELERDRRNPLNQFLNAKADEVAFGTRKYYRGRRVRKHTGVQWGLTIVEVCPVTKSPVKMDLQMLMYNTRSAEVITPLIVQRCKPGGTLTTDC